MTHRIVRLAAGALAASLLVPALAPAEEAAAERRPFSDAAYWAERWESPERKEWQHPVEVLDMLGVDAGDTVADLGAGTGYFTVLLAIVVGDEGRVYAVDTEPAMLEYLAGRSEPEMSRVTMVHAEPDDPKLPEGEIDVVLTVNTWHHIDGRVAYLAKLARALNPWGRVVVVDWRKHELPMGPPPAEKLSREQVISEFSEAGFTLAAESMALPFQYLLVFHPPRADRKASAEATPAR